MTTPGAKTSSFNLLRSFSILSLLCVVVISIVTATVLSRFLEDNMLRDDAEVMRQFIDRIAQHHDPTEYFAARDETHRKAALNDFFRDISHMPDVVRINAYSTDKTIIWSNDKALIGRNFSDNHELDEALAGELVTEVDLSGKTEHVFLDQTLGLVEIYIPLHASSSGQVVGVAEVHKVPHNLSQAVRAGNYPVWLCVSLGGAFLYFALFWIVRRAGHLIQEQHHALVKNTRIAAIGEMAASVSHSIRNPLASIRSSAELAQQVTNQYACDRAADIIEQVDRPDVWIRDLLTFSRESAEAEASASQPAVVAASLDGFTARQPQHKVRVEVDQPGDLPPVRSDPQLLVQVFNNPMANAFEAMPKGGSLRNRGQAEQHAVRLSLSDTGRGMSPEKIEKLFVPLSSHRQGGLGMGLALARQVLQRYGANINLHSDEGLGTTAELLMPTVG